MTVTDPIEGTVRSADGTTIAFERSGTGPPLILVDGAGCYRAFGPLRSLAKLLARDLTVFTYDRRGRGDSTDTPPYAVEREVEDLAALIDAAGGSAFLYGVSSGALLVLRAAASGLAVPRLAVFEPPIGSDDDARTGADLAAEIDRLVADGRRGEAAMLFQRSIGVPGELIAVPPAMAAVAHTLPYDLAISGGTTPSMLPSVRVPTLVLDSAGSSENLTGWAAVVVTGLPDATYRSLPGQWHGVPDEDLAPVLIEFFHPGAAP